jgi:hypothetical protein
MPAEAYDHEVLARRQPDSDSPKADYRSACEHPSMYPGSYRWVALRLLSE